MTPNHQKGIGMPITLAITALVVIVGGITYATLRPREQPTPEPTAKPMLVENGERQRGAATTTIETDETPPAPQQQEAQTQTPPTPQQPQADQPAATFTGTRIAGTSSPLLDFNQADFEQALQSDKLIMLYFYATWCPTCKKETSEGLYPAFNELTSDQVIGFRVNFNDNDTDSAEKKLATQHGVTYQHTKIFLKNGTEISRAPDPWSKTRYLTEITNALAQ